MKIAVAYDNGNVFQHFGKSEMFKIYDVEDGQIVSGEVMDSNGVGHEALAGLLAEQGVRVVICGGMGAGAQAALEEAGIEAVSGAEGSSPWGRRRTFLRWLRRRLWRLRRLWPPHRTGRKECRKDL